MWKTTVQDRLLEITLFFLFLSKHFVLFLFKVTQTSQSVILTRNLILK